MAVLLLAAAASAPAAAASQLVRYVSPSGTDAWVTTGAAPGYTFAGILGTLLDAGGSGRVAVRQCTDPSGDHLLATGSCPAGTVDRGNQGWLSDGGTDAEGGVELFACPVSAPSPVGASTQADCEGAGMGALLGHMGALAGTLDR